jgi:hypothetical protein
MSDKSKTMFWWSSPAVAALLITLSGSAAMAQAQKNSIVALRTASSGSNVEIVITSDEPFLRSDVPVLRIGKQEIIISGPAEDGSVYTRVFYLTAEQFRSAKSGDRVTFQYGSGEGERQRDFGTLDKSKLTRSPRRGRL